MGGNVPDLVMIKFSELTTRNSAKVDGDWREANPNETRQKERSALTGNTSKTADDHDEERESTGPEDGRPLHLDRTPN